MLQKPLKNELMHRYELIEDGKLAFLSWEEQTDGVLVFNHTFVPPELRGHNLAAILTKFALDDARTHNCKVVPQCSYVAAYMERNQGYADVRLDAHTRMGRSGDAAPIDFDAHAKDWDNNPDKWRLAEAVANGIRAAMPLLSEMNALEYGCGTGLLSFALHRDLGQIVLADSSPGMLQVLREKIRASGINSMEPIQLDLTVDSLPARRFSLIYTMMALHHVVDVTALLRQFYTLLETGGSLCVADLDREDGSFHGADFDGHHGFDRAELARMIVDAGFQSPLFATVFHLDKITDEATRSYPLFLLHARKG